MITKKMREEIQYFNPYTVADLIGQPIHIVNSDGIVTYVNRMWEQAYSMRLDQVVGRHISELSKIIMETSTFVFEVTSNSHSVFSDSHPNISSYYQQAAESPAIVALREHRQVTLLTRESNGHLTVCQSCPIFDGQGNTLYVLTTIQDVSVYSNWQLPLDNSFKNYQNSDFPDLIGESPQILLVKHLITLVAKTNATVLLSGESGSGKELVANEIVRHGNRADKPFLSVNCAAIPRDLIESELFGFEKGSFTGATQRRIGLFEQADGGTLLLDEIGEMPIQLQAKLLRVLQENEVVRIGDSKKRRIDVRMITATNKNLLEEIKKGTFRSDLYYRLNVFPIELPPLRAREGDIVKLAEFFLSRFNVQYGWNKEFSPQAIQAFRQYNWPGNARELKNFIERLVIITPEHTISSATVLDLLHQRLSQSLLNGSPEERELPLKDAVDNFERELIYRTLQKHKSTYKAARVLKTSQPTIVRKVKSLQIMDWK